MDDDPLRCVRKQLDQFFVKIEEEKEMKEAKIKREKEVKFAEAESKNILSMLYDKSVVNIENSIESEDSALEFLTGENSVTDEIYL